MYFKITKKLGEKINNIELRFRIEDSRYCVLRRYALRCCAFSVENYVIDVNIENYDDELFISETECVHVCTRIGAGNVQVDR